jgi:hypothetical protein
MKALTLWQPWATAIAEFGKRIENRGWRPPRWIIGERIAIHAGKRLDKDAVEDLCFDFDIDAPRFIRGAVVAVATVKGWVDSIGEDHPQSRWFCGPFGWVFDDVVALREPAPCRGHQKLWNLPAAVEAAVRGQL